jgi:hypothetical protein
LLDSKESVVFGDGNMAKVGLDNSLYDAMKVLTRAGDGVEFSGEGAPVAASYCSWSASPSKQFGGSI